jgi:hypothetical protein
MLERGECQAEHRYARQPNFRAGKRSWSYRAALTSSSLTASGKSLPKWVRM